MTRSKALLFLLAASVTFMLISSVRLWTNRASGWAFFAVGTIGVLTYIASLSADVVTVISSARKGSIAPADEFDI